MKSEEVSLYLFIKRKNIAGKIMGKKQTPIRQNLRIKEKNYGIPIYYNNVFIYL